MAAEEKKKNETSDFLKQIKDIASGLKSLSGISKKQSKNIKKSLGLVGKAIEEMPTGKDTNVSIAGMEDLGKGIASLSEVSKKGAKRSKKSLKILGNAFGDFAKKLDGKSVAKAINGFDQFGDGILKFSKVGWSKRKRIVKSLEDIGGAIQNFGGSPSMTKAFKATGSQFDDIVKNIEKLASLSKKRKGIVKTLKSIGGAFGVALTGMSLKGSDKDSKLEAKEKRKEDNKAKADEEKREDKRFDMLTGAVKGIDVGGGDGGGGIIKAIMGILPALGPILAIAGGALLGSMAGEWINKNFINPWLDDYYMRYDLGQQAADTTITREVFVETADGGSEKVYSIDTSQDEKLREYFGDKNFVTESELASYAKTQDSTLEETLKEKSGEIRGATVQEDAQGNVKSGAFKSSEITAEDLTTSESSRAETEALSELGGPGRDADPKANRKKWIINYANRLADMEKQLHTLISKKYGDEDSAIEGEHTAYGVLQNSLNEWVSISKQRMLIPEDVENLKKAFPMMWKWAGKNVDHDSDNRIFLDGVLDNVHYSELKEHYGNKAGDKWREMGGGTAFLGTSWKNLPSDVAFAKGGLVRGPIRGLLGEVGPELVLPLQQAPKFIADVLTKATNTLSNQQVGMQNILSTLSGNSSSNSSSAPVVVNTNTVMKNENNAYHSTNSAVRDVNGIQYKMRNSLS